MLNIIVNPYASNGKGEKLLLKVQQQLLSAHAEYRIFRTHEKGGAKKFAQALTESGETKIVAFGGDGTLNEVLCGLKDPSVCELGLIPAGTGNDFAESALIPYGQKALDYILRGEAKYTDYLQFSDGNRSINIAGFGIDVDILERCEVKGSNKRNKYFRSLLASVFGYKGVKLNVELNGEEKEYLALIAAVCNGKQFGGGIPFCPAAKLDDGKMDLVVVEFPKRSKYWGELFRLMRGKLLTRPITRHVLCEKVSLIPSEPCRAQYDGELREIERMDVEIVSGKLKMFRGEAPKKQR